MRVTVIPIVVCAIEMIHLGLEKDLMILKSEEF